MTTEDDRRGKLRHTVREPCRAIVEGQEYKGSVVNMSVTGAAIHLDIETEIQPPPDTVMSLAIDRIGSIETKVVRSLVGGVAVEFVFEANRDRLLIATLFRVLNEFAGTSRGRSS